MASTPDYYRILEVQPSSTPQQIRDAYKRAALKWHPDRVPSDSPERPTRTKRFQQINDAYYTLSDPSRRREYDAVRAYTHPSASTSYTSPFSDDDETADEEIPHQSSSNTGGGGGGFASYFGFGGGNANNNNAENAQGTHNAQFGSVFEEMLRDEGLAEGREARPTGRFWGIVGAASGGAMGFIVGNAPGALAGAVAGNRLGAVRDKKGKSVYEVFQELPQGDKARLLSELAMKAFGMAVGS